jgi:cytochrome c oxidase subunit 1
MGWGVWAHHMFASGVGPLSVAAFSVTTMFIAVPTGVKILNWMATMYGGKLTFTTPMLFAIGLVTMFSIGGLSGVTHAVSPADTQQTDTYYIVAHFHYVLFGGSFLAFMGGLYFWWPKVFGWTLSDKLGKWNFWIMLVGFNLTFGPMHVVGLEGQPRRTATYASGMGWDIWNLLETIGAFILAFSVLLLFINIFYSRSRARHRSEVVGPDPWDSRSLEWSIPSPAPAHNFDVIPTVERLDDWWHRKYGEDERGKLVPIATAEEVAQKGDATGVHLPSPSYWPIVMAFGLPWISYGFIFKVWPLAAIGFVILFAGLYGWGMEPSTDPDAGHHGDDGHDGHDDGATAETVADEEAATVG